MINIKKISTLAAALVACFTLVSCTGNAEESDSKEAAQKAAMKWLPILDSGDYAQAREASADVMQSTLTAEQFENTFSAVLKPLGAVESRKLKSATYTTQLPGTPDGRYVVLQFRTSFANKKRAIETVVMERGDGESWKADSWKVSGYFIK